MNVVSMTGRLTKDVTFYQNPDTGKCSASFSIAVTDPRDTCKCDYFNVVAWGTKADFIKKGYESGRYRKGCHVEVYGNIHAIPYKTKNGEKRINVEISADNTFSEIHSDYKSENNVQNQPIQNGMSGVKPKQNMPQQNYQNSSTHQNQYHQNPQVPQNYGYQNNHPQNYNNYQNGYQQGYPRPNNYQNSQPGGFIPASYQR